MNNAESKKKPFTIQVIRSKGGNNLIELGRFHELEGIQPQFPEYLQYYKAWSLAYREYLLSRQFSDQQ